jgi:DNA helicase II / ATP-dependent DNA helicase PcrA
MKLTLNKDQKKAVNHRKGPLLVVAGAGTGKTRVITERVRHLIQKQGIGAKEILALTFTNKAATEMLERIGDVMPLGYEEPWVYTFHTFADRILRAEGIEIGIDPSYKILSYSEQWLMLRKNLFKFELKYFRPLGNPTKFISAILKFISRLQDENISTEEFGKFAKNFSGDTIEKERWEELAHIYERYEELKLEKSKMDFGDLITWNLKLFEQRPNILKKYQTQFKHVLVDEFQDTNYAQYELVKLICPQKMDGRSLMVVGDDSQSIYKFRGAAVSNILQFMEDYPDSETITLLENYRSTQKILDPAYKLIQNNNPDTLESKLGISKELTSKGNQEGPDPQILKLPTLEDEVEQVVLKILEILGTEPEYTFKDFAILARANNHLEPFVLALRKHGLPYQLAGNRGLYDRDEIRDVLAFLRVLINPKDSISLYRILNIDSLKVPYEEISRLLSQARYKKVDLWEILKTSFVSEAKTTYEIVKEFQEKITKRAPHEFVYELVNSISYLEQFLIEETVENNLCIKNLDMFLNRIKKFEQDFYNDTKEVPNIVDLIDYLDLVIEAGENPAQAEIEDIDTVNLMTVHASKGLEFPAVFVVNLTSDRFPTRNKKDVIQLPDEIIKETLPTGDEHIQEERRLFYVAMTRAQKYLFATLGKDYGGKREKIPSGFLTEIGLPMVEMEGVERSEQDSLFGVTAGYKKPTKSSKGYNMGNLSHSKLDKYQTCPLQFKYSFVLNIPTPPNPALTFGITMHETLHDYHLQRSYGKNVSWEGLLEMYKDKWAPLGYLDEDHQNLRYESGVELLKKYYAKNKDRKLKHKGLEEWFRIKVGPDTFVGKIDRIDMLPGGGVEIIDYKTGAAKDQKIVDKDAQLTFYSMGAKEALGLDVKKLTYYYLEEGKEISTVRTEAQLEEKRDDAEALAKKIKSGDFTPKPGMHCTWCDYKNICPSAYKK